MIITTKKAAELREKAVFDALEAERARPSAQDIRQLENLVLRGVNQNDIEDILGITAAEFYSWGKNLHVDRIKKMRAKQEPEKFTVNHVSLSGQTELAFESGLIKFYRFKEEYRMPEGRYKYVYKRFKEADLRMTRETLQEYIKQLKSSLDGSKKQVNLGTAWKLLNNMENETLIKQAVYPPNK